MIKPISITTDFGLQDEYVGVMKGVICAINPAARIIDLCHQVARQSVRAGALMWQRSLPYFPESCIHLGVVDPGVGTDRKALIFDCGPTLFVVPDNGLVSLCLDESRLRRVIAITNPKLALPNPGSSFHGRDIFAPAAAHLSKGVDPTEFGPDTGEWLRLPPLPKPQFTSDKIRGEILHIDVYGNAVSNITRSDLQRHGSSHEIKVCAAGKKLPLLKSYGEGTQGQPLALIGSWSTVEIAVNQGSAQDMLNLKVGDTISILMD